MRLPFSCAVLIGVCASRGAAQQIPLANVASLTIPAGVDTLDRCLQPRGGAVGRCGSPYIRIVEARTNGTYELRNEYFDSSRTRTAVQITRTSRALAVRYQRVQDVRDSAALVIADGFASAWVASPRGLRLVGTGGVEERYDPELLEQALAIADPPVGSIVVVATGNLYAADPIAVSVDTLRVAGRVDMVANGARVPAVVIVRGNGNTSWVEAKRGRILARRGKAGPNADWWHVRQGAQLPPAAAAPHGN